MLLEPKSDNLDAKTDEELVALIFGNQELYLHLMRRYEAKILRYIMRISGLNHDDAEDVLQEVFIKAYKNLHDFDPGLKFSSWLYRIAHNETVSHFRKTKSRPQIVRSQAEDGDGLLEKIAVDPDFQRLFDGEIVKRDVRQALDGLDEKYRTALILRYMEERDYGEISDILEKPMGTVATLINRAKERLRNEINKRGQAPQ